MDIHIAYNKIDLFKRKEVKMSFSLEKKKAEKYIFIHDIIYVLCSP